VIGRTTGASLKIIILVEANSRDEKSSLAGSIKGSTSGGGFELSGSVSSDFNTSSG
jgi:5-enolpyruvylshikimate-3-phosphate synthase